jgi:1-deoxy-D-xylulose-5-phosphate reductoisomerase
MPRNVVILGSTGSIGRQTLDIIRSMPERIRVLGLAAGSSATELARQCAEFHPAIAVLADAAAARAWNLSDQPMHTGTEALVELAAHPDAEIVVVATVGAGGLLPALAALRAGKLVALANKETLVMAGSLIRLAGHEGGATLVPIDSEHSAIWQCLQGEPEVAVERMTLTASGGALRGLSLSELARVTPEQALRHPTWRMGQKVTIDSATLMNKGLEVLEAQWLFDLPIDRIDVLRHEQSVVHSMVTFVDGSTKAQLGLPDMRLPIQYALSHPERWPNDLERLDLATVGNLSFGPIDHVRYPALDIAIEAGRAGGTAPAVLCAADEVAVAAFLNGQAAFTAIAEVVSRTLSRHENTRNASLEDILESDRWARRAAARIVEELSQD